MLLRNFTYALIIIWISYACNGVSETEYVNLQAENAKLKTQLDECQNGADKLAAAVEKAYAEGNYTLAKKNIELLYEKHPESPKNEDFKPLLVEIEEKEAERIRLENRNNTGIWEVTYYVDDFGEKTNQGYITNTDYIKGYFNNTATQNSDLNVRFLITDPSDISFKLFEYAGNNPVKAISTDEYQVLVQDKDGNRLKLRATLHEKK